MKYDYRFLRQNQYFELPYVGINTIQNETPPLRSRIKSLEHKIKQKPKLKEFVEAQYDFYLPTFITPKLPKKEQPIETQIHKSTYEQQQEDIVSPTLKVIKYELKQSNPYQFTIPSQYLEKIKFADSTERIKKKQSISPTQKQMKDFNVLAKEKYNEKNFQEYRQLRQQRMNGIIQMLQNPFPQQQQLKQEQRHILQKNQTLLVVESKVLNQTVSKFKILRIKLTRFLNKLKKMNLNPRQFMEELSIDQFQQVLYKPAKSKEIFEEYFQLIKQDDVGELQLMLNKNPFLVYSYDHAHLSGLHWAAKRGFIEIAKLLIQFNADVDSKDFVKRTPLYLAILLFHQADPWSTEFINYKDIIKSIQVKQLFALSRKIHILLQITPANQREAIWNKEAPAMSIIKNLTVQNSKRNYQVIDVSQKYPTLDQRLQDLNNILQKREKKMDIHKHQQDIERKVERDIKCFSILNTQNASLQNQYQ